MAMFGKDAGAMFLKVQQARRNVEVAAGMLMRAAIRNQPYEDHEFSQQLEADIWNTDQARDKVGELVKEFASGVEKLCIPIVTHGYRAPKLASIRQAST